MNWSLNKIVNERVRGHLTLQMVKIRKCHCGTRRI